jgi:uncharacterized membrane protein YhaH (DUF805 family)
MNWYLKCLRQFADFKGRARRKEYWMFYLINFIIGIFILVIAIVQGSNFLIVLYFILFFVTYLPSIAVTVRRLHDTGNAGWMFFVIFIPLIGAIWLLILLVKDGEQGENGYGPDPKEEAEMSFDNL